MCTALEGYPTPIYILFRGALDLNPWGMKKPVFDPTLKQIYAQMGFYRLIHALRIDLCTSGERAFLPKFENKRM